MAQLTTSQQAFVDQMLPYAQAASAQTGIDPAVIIAQAALESGWGHSAPGNNFFGIKGPGQIQSTVEYENGVAVPQKASFKAYDSPAASFQSYANLMNTPFYAAVKNASGIAGQTAALGKSGYATDPNYGSLVQSIANNVSGSAPPGTGGSAQAPAAASGVAATQAALQQAGLYNGPIDGVAGPQTKAAVTAFQTAHGLTPDGIVGPQTLAALSAPPPPSTGGNMLAQAGLYANGGIAGAAPATMAYAQPPVPPASIGAVNALAGAATGGPMQLPSATLPPENVLSSGGMSPLFAATPGAVGTLPQGPYGIEKLIQAGLSGDPKAIWAASDAVKWGAIYDNKGKNAEAKLADYFQTYSSVLGPALTQLSLALQQNPALAQSIVPEIKTQLLANLGTAFLQVPKPNLSPGAPGTGGPAQPPAGGFAVASEPLPAPAGPDFGYWPQPQPAGPGGTAFGTPSPGLGFGLPAQPNTGVSATPVIPGSAFGNLGTAQSQPPANGGFAFGQVPAQSQSYGAPSAGLSFGGSDTQAPTAADTSFNYWQNQQTNSISSYGMPQAQNQSPALPTGTAYGSGYGTTQSQAPTNGLAFAAVPTMGQNYGMPSTGLGSFDSNALTSAAGTPTPPNPLGAASMTGNSWSGPGYGNTPYTAPTQGQNGAAGYGMPSTPSSGYAPAYSPPAAPQTPQEAFQSQAGPAPQNVNWEATLANDPYAQAGTENTYVLNEVPDHFQGMYGV